MRKFFALVASLTLVFTGLSALPSWASAPVDGAYDCNTGVIQNSPSYPNFTLNNGAVSAAAGCVGAVTLPSGVLSIAAEAFRNATSVTAISIPASLTSIGYLALYSTAALTAITVDSSNASFSSVAGVLFNKAQTTLIKYPPAKSGTSYTAPSSVTALGDFSFTDAGSLTSISIPNGVTTLGMGSFARTGITSFLVPAAVTAIPDYTFQGTPLTSITIPAGVTSIGGFAFYEATSLATVSFAGQVAPSIGSGAFSNITSPPSVTIPLSTTGVGSGAGWSGLTVTRPNGTLSCGGDGTFTVTNSVVSGSTGNCSGAVEIPYGITSVGYAAFWQRAITSASIPRTVTTISDHAFRQTSMTSVLIPASVQTIGYLSFGTTLLTQLTFESGSALTTIGNEAFQSSQFTSVILPASVTSVSGTAFQFNNNLTSINYLGTIPSGWPWSAPAGVNVSGNVNCGTSGHFVIQANTVVGRRDCTGSVVIPAGVTVIAGEAFDATADYGNGVGRENPFNSTIGTNITSLTIPNTVTTIGWFAFRDARVSSLVIPNSVTSIGIYAFAGVTATSITIGNGLPELVNAVFAGASNLQTLTLGSGLRAIGTEAFAGASSLTTLTIPDGVESIGINAFQNVGGSFTLNYCGNADLAGTGLPSVASNASTCVPAPPRNVSVTPGNGSANVTFSPGNAGGAVVTNYKYSLDGVTYTTRSPASTSSPLTISGLTNGNSYSLYLKAVNANGDGAPSAPITFYAGLSAFSSPAIGGVTVPTIGGAPVSTVTAGDGFTGTVAWSGSPTTFEAGQYTATITLTANAGYTFAGVPANFFTVAGASSATNAANSHVITAVFPTLYIYPPGAPTQVVATRTSPTTATVSFAAPSSNGGSPITSYTATLSPSGISSTLTQSGSGTLTFSGLDPAESYIFEVMATNQGGNSDAVYSSWVLGANYDPATGDGVVPCVTDGTVTGAGFFTVTSNVVTDSTDCVGAVVIPQGAVTVGEDAFWDNSEITSVSMAASVTTIEDLAFGRLDNMTSLTIGSGVLTIGERAFERAYELTSLVIPDGVLTVGHRAFRDLESLTSLTVGNGVTTIGASAFRGLDSLTSLIIGNSVTSIGSYAFTGLASLTTLTLPASLDSIDDYAFGESYSMTTVRFLGDAPAFVGDSVFDNLPAGAAAVVGRDATGFGTDPTWNGLVLTRGSVQTQNQNQNQNNGFSAFTAMPTFTFVTRPVVSAKGQSLALKGENLSAVTSVKIAGKEVKVSKISSGELVIDVPTGTVGYPEVVIVHSGGTLIMQGLIQVVKPYTEKRTQKIAGLTGSAPSKSALAALQKSYLAGTPANLISCVATVANNASAKDITAAKKLAKSTCQAMVEFSSFINNVDVQVSKTGRAGAKSTLAVTFDRTLSGR